MDTTSLIRHNLVEVIEHNTEGTSFEIVQECFLNVQNLLFEPNISRRAAEELLILCAEAAYKVGLLDTAKQATEEYFLSFRHENQLCCRILIVQGLLFCVEARCMTGKDEVGARLKSVDYFCRAIHAALNNKHCEYLVYNAALGLWHAIRPLIRPAFCKHTIPGLQSALKALRETNGSEYELMGHLSFALAVAFEETKQVPDAQSAIKAAKEYFNKKLETGSISSTMKEAIVATDRLSVHLGQQSSVALAKSTKTNKEFEVTIQCIRSGIIPLANAQTEMDEMRKLKDDYETIVELGRLAVMLKLPAESYLIHALQKKSNSSSVEADINFDLFRCEYLVFSNDSKFHLFLGRETPIPTPANKSLTDRVESLKVLERTVASIRRIGNSSLLEDCSTLIWNIGLPLLQPSLRKHVHRVYQQCVEGLAEVSSSNVNLRALFHTEIAKCDIALDFLSNASDQVDTAIQMAQQTEGDSLGSFLKPLQKKLKLKSNMYQDSESKYEQLIVQVEQAKDTKDPSIKLSILKRAMKLLESNSSNHNSSSMLLNEDDAFENKDILQVYSDICAQSWEVKAIDMASQAASKFLNLFELEEYQDVKLDMLAIQVHFVACEIYVERIRKLILDPSIKPVAGVKMNSLGLQLPSIVSAFEGFHHGDVIQAGGTLVWETATIPFPPTLSQWKLKVIKHLSDALHLAEKVNEPWIIENAIVYLWNYHLHMFAGSSQRMKLMIPELKASLNGAFDALSKLDASSRNPALFCNVCEALARVSESDALEKGITVCRTGLASTNNILHKKSLFALLHRLSRLKKCNEPLPTDAIELNFCVIELLQLPVELIPSEEKKILLGKAYEALVTNQHESPLLNEVAVRLARLAVEVPNLEYAEDLTLRALSSCDASKSKEQFRWYSIAECLNGKMACIRAETLKDEKSMQDSLYHTSLLSFERAAQHGVSSQQEKLVLDAGKEAWNASSHLLSSKFTRALIFQPLLQIISHLETVKGENDVRLLLNLFSALIECFKDTKDWQGGFHFVQNSFKKLPQNSQRTLWEAYVVFGSKLGKDVGAGLMRTKDASPVLQSRGWVALARTSTTNESQLAAYINAVDILKESPSEKCDVLVELGAWLHANHFSRDEVTQCLLQAADIFLENGAEENVDNRFKNLQVFVMLAQSVSHSKIRHDMGLVAFDILNSIFCKDLGIDDLKVEHALNTFELKLTHHAVASHYLFELCDILQECGQDMLAVFPSIMIEIIDPKCIRAKLHTVNSLFRIGFSDLAVEKLNGLNFILDEDTRRQASVQSKQILSHPSYSSTTWRFPPAVPPSDELKATKQVTIGTSKVREEWTRVAQELLQLGYVFDAKVYIEAALEHNEAFEDWENESRTCLMKAHVCLLEGQADAGMVLISRSMDALRLSHGGSVKQWLGGLDVVVQLGKLSKTCSQRIIDILQQSLGVFVTKSKSLRHLKDLDLEIACSYLETWLGHAFLDNVISLIDSKSPWESEWELSKQAFENGLDRILVATKPNCAAIATVDILYQNANVLYKLVGIPEFDKQATEFQTRALDYLSRASKCVSNIHKMVISKEFSSGSVLKLPISIWMGKIQLRAAMIEQSCIPAINTFAAADKDTRLSDMSVAERYLFETAPTESQTPQQLRSTAMVRSTAHALSAMSHLMPDTALYGQAHTIHSIASNSGTHGLLESIALTTQLNVPISTEQAAMAFVDCSEPKDFQSVQMLLLAQSCAASKSLDYFAESVCNQKSKMSLFRRLVNFIGVKTEHPSQIPIHQKCKERLNNMQPRLCWNDIAPEQILQQVPSSITFLVLRVYNDKLYSSMFNKENRRESSLVVTPLHRSNLDRITHLLQQMEKFSRKITCHLRKPQTTTLFEQSSKDEELQVIVDEMKDLLAIGIPDCDVSGDLMILVDELLAPLPLEMMFSGCRSITRDLSLHIMYHRLRSSVTSINPKDEDTEPSLLPCPSSFVYLVDPRDTTYKETFETNKPISWKNGWIGATDGIPSTGVVQQLISRTERSNLFYLGAEDFLSNLSSDALCGMNLGNCVNAFFIDRSDVSGKLSESPMTTIKILSLFGVGSVTLNMWRNPVLANKALAESFLSSPSSNIAQTIQKFRSQKDDQENEIKLSVKCNVITYGLGNLS